MPHGKGAEQANSGTIRGSGACLRTDLKHGDVQRDIHSHPHIHGDLRLTRCRDLMDDSVHASSLDGIREYLPTPSRFVLKKASESHDMTRDRKYISGCRGA